MRPQTDELSVADHAQAEQCREVQHELLSEGKGNARSAGYQLIQAGHQAQRNQRGRGKALPVIPARMVETDDKRQQVQAQRRHPQEGHHRDVLADVVGRGQEHHGGQCRQQQPGGSQPGRRRHARSVRHVDRLVQLGMPRPRRTKHRVRTGRRTPQTRRPSTRSAEPRANRGSTKNG